MAEQEAVSELVRLNGELVAVPAAICEHRSMFDAVVSMDSWNSLSNEHKQHLRTLLPSFSGSGDSPKQLEETVQQLLGAEGAPPLVQLAGCPRDRLFSQLHQGKLTDEIHALRRLTAETRAHDAKVWLQTYQDSLLRELLLKRKTLLDASVRTPAGTPVTQRPSRKQNRRASLEQRARKRYFQELEQARAEAGCNDQELSPDENYPEGAPPPLTRKQQRRLSKLEASLGGDHVSLTATASRRHQRSLHLSDHVTQGHNPFEVSDGKIAQMLMKRKKQRAKGQVPAASATTERETGQLQTLLKREPPSHSSDSDSDSGDTPPAPAVAAAPAAAAAARSVVREAAALGHQTHASFFSLLRDVLCSDPADRLPAAQLFTAVRGWQQSPISALNEWYQQQPSWVEALPSALAFLSGEVPELQTQINLVPFLNHSRETGVYQWIGAGRDSDIHLESLCAYWRHRKDTIVPTPETPVTEPASKLEPPLHPTSWTVQPSTDAEKDEYRRQERQRYQQPRRAFTYHLHGYRSVVGPVRGGGRDWRTARGHALLAPDRPPSVTLLSLVRDAVARLPNGQGTRADLLVLVRDSGYLAPEAALAGAVSSALDRLHAELDPCVRYDAHRKLWVYLHRHRSEADFEAIYRERQASAPRSRRTTVRRSVVPSPAAASSSSTTSVSAASASATTGVSLLKPRSAVRPEAATAAAGLQEPALSQTELAVQSILPLDVTDVPAPVSRAVVPAANTITAAATTTATATAAGQSLPALQTGAVKVMKNQHAIVHIPSKTPGAAPQLALFANGKLIPIVNQPQTAKSAARPLGSVVAASGGGAPLLGPARPLLAARTQLVSARPTPSSVAGAVPTMTAVAAAAARRPPLSGGTAAAPPQLVQVSCSAPASRLQPLPSASIRFTSVRPAAARPTAAGTISAGSPRLPAVRTPVGSPRPGAAQPAVSPRLAVTPPPRLGSVQMLSPRLSSVQSAPASPRLSPASGAAQRLSTLVQTQSVGPRVTAAAAGAPSQLKHITIPVSQLSRLLQSQGGGPGGGAPLTLAQIGGKQVLIAARPAGAGTTGGATKQQAQVVVQTASASPAPAAVNDSTPPRAVMLSTGAAAGPVLLPTALKTLQGYKLVQLPTTPPAAAVQVEGSESVSPVKIALSLPSVVPPATNHVQLQSTKPPESG